MIIHLPHDSRYIPEQYLELFVLEKEELENELNLMTDSFTDELFRFDPADGSVSRIIYPVSRLVLDPERFADDAQEPMSARGMGVIYTKTHNGEPLRRDLNENERNELLQLYYYPHQQKVAQAVKDELQRNNSVLLIDCHSFPSSPLPCDMNQNIDRPDFCIGTDSFHTPKELVEILQRKIKELGYTVKINDPYAGVFVPSDFYLKNDRVFAVMIEVNRKLYIDEVRAEKSKNFSTVQSHINQLLHEASDWFLKNKELNTNEQKNIDQLFEAYRETDYIVNDRDVEMTIRIGELNPALDDLFTETNTNTGAFLTAYNPYSNELSPDENESRQAALLSLLKEANYKLFNGYGVGKDKDWEPEPSFLILGIDKDQSIALSQRFEQNAFVYLEKEKAPILVGNTKNTVNR